MKQVRVDMWDDNVTLDYKDHETLEIVIRLDEVDVVLTMKRKELHDLSREDR